LAFSNPSGDSGFLGTSSGFYWARIVGLSWLRDLALVAEKRAARTASEVNFIVF
jgi:hypothetical protein